jgi:chorismate dehydratase
MAGTNQEDVALPPRIRIGAVAYLNTKPLIYELERLAPQADLKLEVPSRLADDLAAGSLDAALIPAIEYFRGDGYRVVPGIAIACDGPVLSVTLFSRLPWPDIRRVAVDEGSRTSAALTEIILRQRYGVVPEIIGLPLEGDADSVDADAVLLIGDRAMRACLPGFVHAFDLGQEWQDWTGLPFVFAFWAVRGGADLGPVADALHAAKQRGRIHLGEIAYREASLLGLDAGFCRRYLANIMRYDLGPRELAGLDRYYGLAAQLGLAPQGGSLEFLNSADLVESR